MTTRQKNSLVKRASARLQQTDFLNMNARDLDRTIKQIVAELLSETESETKAA
jgi:hypothetical protein